MLTSGLLAAFAGPEVFAQTNTARAPVTFAGTRIAIILLSAIGVIPLLFLRGLGRRPHAEEATFGRPTDFRAVLRRPAVAFAITAAWVSQGVMVLLMVPPPIDMVGCGFSEASAGHVVAMFAPSFFTGFLIKRRGAAAIVACGRALFGAFVDFAASGLTLPHFCRA